MDKSPTGTITSPLSSSQYCSGDDRKSKPQNGYGSLLCLSVFIVIFSIQGCSGKDDIETIRKLIERGAGFAEKHDIGALMDLTTENFQAMPGKLDRRRTKRILWMAFKHYGDLKIMHPEPAVDLESDGLNAQVSAPFLILKKGHVYPDLKELYRNPRQWLVKVGESADLYRFTFKLIKKGRKWRVNLASIEKFSGLGFAD
ncbi:MAG: hypothetical protein JRJ85_16595 [Deltaproteobacteria bacterium]|nr:hypothetical protein [Deltaproteobacteria bacterium]